MSKHLPEIFVINNAARGDTQSNINADFKTPIWNYGVVEVEAAGFGVEDGAKIWKTDMTANRWSDVLLQDIIDRLEEIDPETVNYNFKSLYVYGGARTQGLDGNIHIDKEFEFNEHNDGYMTIVYFPQNEWEPEWGGELQFFDRTGNVLATYYPEPNTAIVFDSNIPHRGLAPRNTDKVKQFVSFKTFVNKIEIDKTVTTDIVDTTDE
jgi:hypothetical protein